eukprot:NODE_9158_length_1443_cov_6.344985.p3 GENE.NODE_9158_length_1443_cov_6.344985~~NODE_9158_length_1443_cov_6.344985.p3  ORF type:complete len:107 (-),score=5.39 NODE_9158_length_1443_cov_6.344985:189-509(-)
MQPDCRAVHQLQARCINLGKNPNAAKTKERGACLVLLDSVAGGRVQGSRPPCQRLPRAVIRAHFVRNQLSASCREAVSVLADKKKLLWLRKLEKKDLLNCQCLAVK